MPSYCLNSQGLYRERGSLEYMGFHYIGCTLLKASPVPGLPAMGYPEPINIDPEWGYPSSSANLVLRFIAIDDPTAIRMHEDLARCSARYTPDIDKLLRLLTEAILERETKLMELLRDLTG